MGTRFIRQPSEAPNINNADDARMIRYAYGGYDGYIKGKGAELSHTVVGSTFRLNSGVVSLHGYETEIDANGWAVTVTNISTKYYYAVYYEVNLATQDTDIKSTYNTADYPNIQAGDDLTTNSTGTARLLLYTFTAQNGVIANVSKKVEVIKYAKEALEDAINIITGNITPVAGYMAEDVAVSNVYLKRQVNFVLINFTMLLTYVNNVGEQLVARIPAYFAPKTNKTFYGSRVAGLFSYSCVFTAKPNGDMTLAFVGVAPSGGSNATVYANYNGWEIT